MKPARLLVLAAMAFSGAAHAQSVPEKTPATTSKAADAKEAGNAASIDRAVARAAAVIVSRQEGDGNAEWPYEGVYRVNGEIPIGYRIGGTAICAMALMQTPGFADDAAAKSAVERAIAFVVKGSSHPEMSWKDYDAGYDVRGWGYTYGLELLLRARDAGLIPETQKDSAEASARFYLEAIQKTEIPKVGGWNYARPPGKDKVAAPSTFMTAPTLKSLFDAKRAGFEVDAGVVQRALDYLDAARTPAGSFMYSGKPSDKRQDPTPGAVGRMLASECTLYLAGRSSQANIRGALDAFIVHWEWLEKRRAQQGTHHPPYMIAPYYFYYAHYYAAMACELLPENERAEYRRRIRELIFRTRAENGSWNDRVFPRSAAYGTAMAEMSLLMDKSGKPARWKAE